MLTIYKRVC